MARELGLARFGKLSIDGTKVRANASKRKAMSYAHGPGALRATQVAVRSAQWLGQGGPGIPAIQRAGSGQGARGMGFGMSGVERQAVATAAGGVRARLAGEIGSESSTSGMLPDASDPLACPARHCALRCPGAPAHPGSDSDPSIRLRVLNYLPAAQTPGSRPCSNPCSRPCRSHSSVHCFARSASIVRPPSSACATDGAPSPKRLGGCSRRNSVSRRFAAFLSQSPGRGRGQAFFFRPSVFTIASGATTGSTSRRCGCTSTAHSD